jgi:hypothetical protein
VERRQHAVVRARHARRIAERLGDRRKAAECYRFVMAVWRRPDPELQLYVSEAREALARLARTE